MAALGAARERAVETGSGLRCHAATRADSGCTLDSATGLPVSRGRHIFGLGTGDDTPVGLMVGGVGVRMGLPPVSISGIAGSRGGVNGDRRPSCSDLMGDMVLPKSGTAGRRDGVRRMSVLAMAPGCTNSNLAGCFSVSVRRAAVLAAPALTVQGHSKWRNCWDVFATSTCLSTRTHRNTFGHVTVDAGEHSMMAETASEPRISSSATIRQSRARATRQHAVAFFVFYFIWMSQHSNHTVPKATACCSRYSSTRQHAIYSSLRLDLRELRLEDDRRSCARCATKRSYSAF